MFINLLEVDESDIYAPPSKSQGLLGNKEMERIEEFYAYLIILHIIPCLFSQILYSYIW